MIKIKKYCSKEKQVYKLVKIELFGNDISTTPKKHELLKTYEHLEPPVINKKPQEEKKSDVKPIHKKNQLNLCVLYMLMILKIIYQRVKHAKKLTMFIKPITVKILLIV